VSMSDSDPFGYFVGGGLFFVIGFVLFRMVAGDVAWCEQTYDGFGIAKDECNEGRMLQTVAGLLMFVGGVVVVGGLIILGKPNHAGGSVRPSVFSNQKVSIVAEDGESVHPHFDRQVRHLQSTTVFCSKCGNPSTIDTDSNYCKNCGNSLQ